MPFDNHAGTTARPALLRPAFFIGVVAFLLTVVAVRWQLPFAGAAALLLVFGGGTWLSLRMVRDAAARLKGKNSRHHL